MKSSSSKLVVSLCLSLAHFAFGAESTSGDSSPIVAPSGFSTMSAAARLGIRYDPAGNSAESLYVFENRTDAISMPKFIVNDSRVKPTERDVMTDKATIKLAEDTYLSPLYRVTFGPLMQIAAYYFNFLTILQGWHPNVPEAMTFYRQDRRLDKLSEIDSLIKLEAIDHSMTAKEIRSLQYDASEASR